MKMLDHYFQYSPIVSEVILELCARQLTCFEGNVFSQTHHGLSSFCLPGSEFIFGSIEASQTPINYHPCLLPHHTPIITHDCVITCRRYRELSDFVFVWHGSVPSPMSPIPIFWVSDCFLCHPAGSLCDPCFLSEVIFPRLYAGT